MYRTCPDWENEDDYKKQVNMFNWFKEDPIPTVDIKNMTIREVAEATRNMRIADGGLAIMIDKIVMEIEKLQQQKDVK